MVTVADAKLVLCRAATADHSTSSLLQAAMSKSDTPAAPAIDHTHEDHPDFQRPPESERSACVNQAMWDGAKASFAVGIPWTAAFVYAFKTSAKVRR